jgi:Rieske Fe-S protein
VTFTVQQLPALAQVGGSVTGHAAGVPFPLVVLRATASQMLAFDARCPHLGCAVSGAQKLFICPCHGSLFNLDGSVKLGPSERPINALQVTFDGTRVVVKVPA